MPVSPHLQRKLQESLGADAADHLVSLLEDMDSSRADLGALRHEMELGFGRIDARFQQVDARFQQVDQRFEHVDRQFQEMRDHFDQLIAGNQARTEALLEKGLREQTRFFFLAWGVLLAAMMGFYAR